MSEQNVPGMSHAPSDPVIDTTVAHQGRIYDFLAGGEAYFAVDREAALQQVAGYGGLERAQRDIRSNRDFIGRAIRYLAGEAASSSTSAPASPRPTTSTAWPSRPLRMPAWSSSTTTTSSLLTRTS
jgi:hypothetical protein